MNLYKLILLLCFCLPFSDLTQPQEVSTGMLPSAFKPKPDFNKIVVPITEWRVDAGLNLEASSGTGFCLDTKCRFIVTTYHVAMTAQPRKIRGARVINRYFATGPEDEDAAMHDVKGGNPLKFSLNRDLAIFELHEPPNHYKGIDFSLQDLLLGQEVCIYAYPKVGHNLFRSLVKYQGTFKGETTTGLLAFNYFLSDGRAILPGASGGIVVDCKTQQVVGLLSGIESHGEAIALAVPVQTLSDFVSKVQPFLAPSIFPSDTKTVSAVSEDLYPKYMQDRTSALVRRPEESAEIKLLRYRAQRLADSMRNFIAVQSFDWGSGNKMPAAMAEYELRVLDGEITFRKYPEGKKVSSTVPQPPLNDSISTAGQWSDLPKMVGEEVRLKIHQAPNRIFQARVIKVFQYSAPPEDELCKFQSFVDFGFFAFSKIASPGCYGEVWTDEDSNILRMSEHLELLGRWKNYTSVVTYGWLERKNGDSVLVPLAISAHAELHKKVYWCRGMFTNYRMFTTQTRMIVSK
jgi:Trypsin-like peptidase domain